MTRTNGTGRSEGHAKRAPRWRPAGTTTVAGARYSDVARIKVCRSIEDLRGGGSTTSSGHEYGGPPKGYSRPEFGRLLTEEPSILSRNLLVEEPSEGNSVRLDDAASYTMGCTNLSPTSTVQSQLHPKQLCLEGGQFSGRSAAPLFSSYGELFRGTSVGSSEGET